MTDDGPGAVELPRAPSEPLSIFGPKSAVTPHPSDFRSVYEAHFSFVWRMLRRLGVRARDVEDVVQSVFLVVHRRLADFEGRSSLRTWLFGICMRVARDYRSSAYVRRVELSDDATRSAASDGPDALQVFETHERARLVEQILDRMSEAQRIVFVLFEIEGLDGEEIAELLDVPLGTVRSRLRLARKTFSDELGRRAQEGGGA